jgi:uncharacterized protein YchJ
LEAVSREGRWNWCKLFGGRNYWGKFSGSESEEKQDKETFLFSKLTSEWIFIELFVADVMRVKSCMGGFESLVEVMEKEGV